MNVRLSPDAEEQAEVCDTWWRENRNDSPNLFAQELAAMTSQLVSTRTMRSSPRSATSTFMQFGARPKSMGQSSNDWYCTRGSAALWDSAEVLPLAQEFGVSVTAAALRFVSLTDERVAVVCTKRGVIE